MHASIQDLRELLEERMLCLNFILDSKTGICANMYGSLQNSVLSRAPVAAGALIPV
jgi:hypothetical protein